MGMFEHSLELDVLRATAVARISLQSGVGLESVLTALSQAGLGKLQRTLDPLLAQLHAGDPVIQSTREAAEAADARGEQSAGSLLRCLLAEGDAAVRRLEELTEELKADRETRLLAYVEELNGRVQVVTIALVASMFPVLLRILEEIPENDIVPTLHLPSGFIAAIFVVFAAFFSLLLFLSRYRG